MKFKYYGLVTFSLLAFQSTAYAHGQEVEKSSMMFPVLVGLAFLLSAAGMYYNFHLKSKLRKAIEGKSKKDAKVAAKEFDKRINLAIISAFSFLGLGFIFAVIWGITLSAPTSSGIETLNKNIKLEVKTFEEAKDNSHVQNNVVYKDFPPTSGQHFEEDARVGFYDKELPLEIVVHNLEHGDIVIYYKNNLSEEGKEHLKHLTKFVKNGSGVVAVPSDRIQGEVVATAWTKTMELSTLDEDKLGQFIYDNIDKAPEHLPAERVQ